MWAFICIVGILTLAIIYFSNSMKEVDESTLTASESWNNSFRSLVSDSKGKTTATVSLRSLVETCIDDVSPTNIQYAKDESAREEGVLYLDDQLDMELDTESMAIKTASEENLLLGQKCALEVSNYSVPETIKPRSSECKRVKAKKAKVHRKQD